MNTDKEKKSSFAKLFKEFEKAGLYDKNLVHVQSPYDLKIGMLALIRTRNGLESYSKTSVNPDFFKTIPVNKTSIPPYYCNPHNMTWTVDNTNQTLSETSSYQRPYSDTTGTYIDKKGRYSAEQKEIDKEAKDKLDALADLLMVDECKIDGLGMVYHPTGKEDWNWWTTDKIDNLKVETTDNTGNTINISGNSPGYTYGNYATTSKTNIDLDIKYHAHGYKSIVDYFHGSPAKIEQEEDWTEEEQELLRKHNLELFSGKPFNGIIVDRFVPNIKSEKGEEVCAVNLGIPRMYKVLFGDKNVLWFEENDVLPLKPNECPKKS